MGILLKLLSTVCFGIENCLWKLPINKNISYLQSIFTRSLISSSLLLIIVSICLLFDKRELNLLINLNSDINHILLSILLSMYSYFGLHFFNLSLKHGTAGVSASIASIKTWFGVLIGILLFQESITFSFLIAFITILTGIYFIEFKKNTKFSFSKNSIYAMLAAFFWGTSFALFKFPIKWTGALGFAFILECTVCLMAFTIGKSFYKLHFNPFLLIRSQPIYLLMGSLVVLAIILNNYAYSYLPVSTLSLLSNNTQIVTLVFSGLILKEKISLNQYAGIFLIIIAIVLLSYFKYFN